MVSAAGRHSFTISLARHAMHSFLLVHCGRGQGKKGNCGFGRHRGRGRGRATSSSFSRSHRASGSCLAAALPLCIWEALLLLAGEARARLLLGGDFYMKNC